MHAFTRAWFACCFTVISLLSAPTQAANFWSLFSKDEPMVVTVNDAFINLYNAPGRGYPIFHAIERGEQITLIKMRTDWIKVRTERGVEGWIQRKDMALTLGLDGEKPDFPNPNQADYLTDRMEFGAAVGDFDGAKSFSANLGYRFTKNLSTELRLVQNTGEFADSQIVALALIHQPFPELRVSPFLGIAAGQLKTMPSSTLVQTLDRTDNLYQASLGAYAHITGRFFIRAEFIHDNVLTSRDTNQEVKEWKIGFNVFF